MIRSILVAFAALVAINTAGMAQVATLPEPQRPSLKSEAIINGDIVRIGDLIENAGIVATVPIFRAPDLGYTGTVSADAVLEAVRKHALIGVNVGDVREVTVTRASRTIPADEIEDVIAKSLSARHDLGSSKDIVVTFAREMRAIYVEPSAQRRTARHDTSTTTCAAVVSRQRSKFPRASVNAARCSSPAARWRQLKWQPSREQSSAASSSRTLISSWSGVRAQKSAATLLRARRRLWG